VLFQVEFLSLLLEERGAGDLAAVADRCRAKLIRRHPHVFGDVEAADAGTVLRNWGRIKLEDERGGEVFGELPETLPATLYATKMLRRAAAAGAPARDAGAALADARRAIEADFPAEGEDAFAAIGELMLAIVDAARALGADPELALRAAAHRHRARIEEETNGSE
jgi:uncharacterized protein YabN with tetrapyrrole methylase and pyrophosphatase domain